MTLFALMCVLCSQVVFVDGFGIPEAVRSMLADGQFGLEEVDLNNKVIRFVRNGIPFMKLKVDSWAIFNGMVKFTTPKGNWCLLKAPGLVNPYKFTKVVYRYCKYYDSIPLWFHGDATLVGDVYELHLTSSYFIPDGKWNEESDDAVEALKEEGNFIYKGEVTIRGDLLEALKPIAKRYNSFGEFGFRARRETKQEAMKMATNRDEKDFIRWYLAESV